MDRYYQQLQRRMVMTKQELEDLNAELIELLAALRDQINEKIAEVTDEGDD
jgi:hypothetical protein